MIVIQVDPEVPVSVRKSLEERDSNFRKNQEDKTGGSLSREASGSENSEKSESGISKRRQDSLSRLARPNLARPPSRPASASGQVPSIIMLTSVDHSDAARYSFNSLRFSDLLRGKHVNYIQLHNS